MSEAPVKTTILVTLLTLCSRVLGLARDLLIAQWFGVSGQTDAFFTAFRIPNLIRRLLTEGAFSQALLPAFRAHARQATLPEFLGHLLARQLRYTLALVILGWLTMPIGLRFLAPGFMPGSATLELTITLSRLMLPYLILASLIGVLSAGLLFADRPLLPAAMPIVLNSTLIAAGLLASRLTEPMIALAIGLIAAALLQVVLAFLGLGRAGLKPDWRARNTVRESYPVRLRSALVLAVISQSHWLVDTVMATFLSPGSVSWLYYGERLLEFPLGLINAVLSSVFLVKLVRHHGENSAKFQHLLSHGLSAAVLIGLPATLGLTLLARPIIGVLFLSEQFTPTDVTAAADSLAAYAPGLFGLILSKVWISGFAATGRLESPTRIAGLILLTHLVLDAAILPWLGHAGLAAAASLSWLLQALMLERLAQRYRLYRPSAIDRRWPLAALFGASWLLFFLIQIDQAGFLAVDERARAGLYLMLSILAGVAIYGAGLMACLGLMGLKERIGKNSRIG